MACACAAVSRPFSVLSAGMDAAEALGTVPSRTLVLEDSYNGVRAGAAGHFVTVMVPDMAPADDEMRRLYTAECRDLYEVLDELQNERF